MKRVSFYKARSRRALLAFPNWTNEAYGFTINGHETHEDYFVESGMHIATKLAGDHHYVESPDYEEEARNAGAYVGSVTIGFPTVEEVSDVVSEDGTEGR